MLKRAKLALFILAASASGFSSAEPVTMQAVTPYAADAKIAQKIRTECTKLGTQLAAFTQEFGKKNGVEVQLTESLNTAQKGRVLQLEITDAVSMGNAFIGHQKFSTAQGTLFQDGKKVASFEARRISMGGAFANYKGSCSVLGRTVKVMGKDIAAWLKAPTDNALLGDQ